MMTRQDSILRRAFHLLSPRWVAMQITLALAAGVLFVVWLRLPDSSGLSIVLTVVVGVCLLALVGGGESYLLQRLRGQPIVRRRIVVGGLAILVGLALIAGWNAALDHLAENDSLWAGYWNSRFPHTLRNLFSYSHIFEWLTWLSLLLSWLGCGLVAAIVISTITDEPMRSFRRITSSFTYWVSMVVGLATLNALFGWIANWTPGHGVLVETLSLLVRMVVLVIVEGTIASLLIAVAVAAAQRSNTDAGTPVESQPLTTDAP